MKFVVLIALVLCCFVVSPAQRWRDGDTLGESVDLSSGTLCGDPQFTTIQILTGVVKKRVFGESETILKGIVLADAKDQRHYLNIDHDFLADTYSGNTIDSISEDLMIGTHIRAKVDVCGRIYVLRRIKVVKP